MAWCSWMVAWTRLVPCKKQTQMKDDFNMCSTVSPIISKYERTYFENQNIWPYRCTPSVSSRLATWLLRKFPLLPISACLKMKHRVGEVRGAPDPSTALAAQKFDPCLRGSGLILVSWGVERYSTQLIQWVWWMLWNIPLMGRQWHSEVGKSSVLRSEVLKWE
jgi:hypothetical protein